jgi:hypothetical protein
MYRRLSKRQEDARARKMQAMRAGLERARMARPLEPRMPDLPLLRRELIVIDYDAGQPVTHTMHMYRTNRIDRYRIEADGQPWKCGGWSMALAGLRKAMQRLPSPRSDLWGGPQGYTAQDEIDAMNAG